MRTIENTEIYSQRIPFLYTHFSGGEEEGRTEEQNFPVPKLQRQLKNHCVLQPSWAKLAKGGGKEFFPQMGEKTQKMFSTLLGRFNLEIAERL